MNGFVLFMMFFVSPPVLPGKQVWSLHSTANFEFASMDACIKYGEHMQDQMDTTDTVRMRGWCVNKGTGASTYAAPPPQQSQSAVDFYEIPSKRLQPKPEKREKRK